MIFLNPDLNVLENEEVVLKTATQDFVVVEAAPEVDNFYNCIDDNYRQK